METAKTNKDIGVNVKQEADVHVEPEAPLKGTWFSLGLLGAVIIITYIVILGLYMDRV